MPENMTAERKQLGEIASEKKFLQTRWKALKDEEEGKEAEEKEKIKEENKDEKSYIQYRWKHLNSQEKALKSVLDNKSIKNVTPAPETFAKKFKKSQKSLKEVRSFLKGLSDLPTSDFKDGHKLQSFHYGRKMDESIGQMFGGESGDEGQGYKTLAKLLLVTKDFPELKRQITETGVEDPNGPSKYSPGDKLQQFGDGGSLVKKGKDFPEMQRQDSEVNITNPKNPSEIAKLGEDTEHNPFNSGNPGSREAGHLIPGVGKKQFDVLDEETGRVCVTKPGSPSHYNPGQESMQQFGEGGTLVKFFKAIADSGAFLKTLAYEKAFGDRHREMAKSLHKALETADMDMDEPYLAQFEELIPGGIIGLEQEDKESEHHPKDKEKALPGDAMGGDPMSMGDPLMEEEEEGDLAGLEGGPEMGMKGVKSLEALQRNALQQAQEINVLTKSLNDFAALLN